MAQFVAFDPKVEVSGRAVCAVIDGMGIFQKKAGEILAKHGLGDLDPEAWYLQQNWLDAFHVICDELGSKTLFEIGSKIPENAIWPEGISGIEDGLRSIGVAYKLNHRGGKFGSYEYFEIDEHTGRLICNNPYPEDFDHGLITAVSNKFKPSGTFMVEVCLDATLPNRKDGADYGSYMINW